MMAATIVTEQLKARKGFEETNHSLKIALDAGLPGLTEIGLDGGKIIDSDQFKRNYGQLLDLEFIYTDLFNVMFPQYREPVQQLLGLGLLYIFKEIVQHHGSAIGVDGELGAGSTFWFTLPSRDSNTF